MNKLDNLPLGLTYDDVLIVPQASEVEPTRAQTKTKLTKNIELEIPIVSAPMDRVTEAAMCIELSRLGGIGILHRNNTIEEQIKMVKAVKAEGARLGAAIGPFDVQRAQALNEEGVDVIVIDTAHGHNLNVVRSAEKIKQQIQADLVVGNIATPEAAEDLCDFADGLRVGVGPGSICTTRIITGAGYPQLSAVAGVSSIAQKRGVPVIADGGIRYSGDMVKALVAGASSIMNGSMLAGTDESPGEMATIDGKKYKTYRGMGSLGAIAGTDRYGQGGSKKVVPEGIEGVTAHRGSVEDLVFQLIGGLQAGMGYIGSQTIEEMYRKGRFMRITSTGRSENHPHTVIMTEETLNYGK